MPYILYVEDDDADALLVKRALRHAGLGFTLCRVSSAHSAIAYLDGTGDFTDRALFPLPVLVLLDIKLPGADGFAVLAWIRSRPQFAHLPVVMLTGSELPSHMEQATQLGANGYFVKQSHCRNLLNFLGTFDGGGDPRGSQPQPPRIQRWHTLALDGAWFGCALPWPA